MALYPTVKAYVDAYIYDNITEDITGAIHNAVCKQIIDACGAAQVYASPAVTDNPGTPENPRAYIALPGVYTNFGGVEVTAPIGIISWNGTAWSVTQIAIPSAYERFQCKTTAELTAGSPCTTVAVSMMNGGMEAIAGQWVQLVNRRTGVYDFVQLTADVADDATSITFKSWTMQEDFPAGSIVEFNPMVNMMTHAKDFVGNGTNNYITLPSDWRTLPSETTDARVWEQHFDVYFNGVRCWRSDTISAPFHYDLNTSNRLRMEFLDVLTPADKIIVKYFQPRKLTIVA